MSFAALEAEFEQRLDQCWLSIVVADVAQLGAPHGWNTVSRDVRAGAAVFAIAEFEALLKDSIEELHAHIEQSGRTLAALCDGVRMLHFDGRFSAAAGSRLDAAWTARREVGSSHQASVPPALPRRDSRGFLQPVGSMTPNPTAVMRIWLVYGLPGTPFPEFSWRRALGELADIRNDVAHRRAHLTLAMSGQNRTADAIAEYILHLRDLGKHVSHSLDLYAGQEGYAG